MRPIAIDTNTYAGFKRGHAACVEVFLQAELLLVSTVVLAELLAGFACGSREAQNRADLREFLDSRRVSHKEAAWLPPMPTRRSTATCGKRDDRSLPMTSGSPPAVWNMERFCSALMFISIKSRG